MRTGTRQGIARGFSQVITRLEDSVQTDGDLLTRFIGEREEEAFALLVHRHGPLVLGVCQRVIGDKELADDAFQAVFLVLARKAHTVHPQEALRGWLHGVATRTALRARRAARRRQKRETLVADIPDRPQPQSDTVDPDVRRRLDEEIARLPDHLRVAVVLCELDGLGRKDAASRLGIPEGTLSSRLAKARQVLAGRLRGIAVIPIVLTSVDAAAPAALSEAAIKNVRVNLGHAVGNIPFAVQSLSREVVRGMMRTYLKVGIAFYLIVVAGLIGASAEDEPINEQPPKVAAALPVAPPPKKVIPPKDRVLAAWEDAQKNLKSGIGKGEYEWTNSKGEPLKYALKVYHDGKKFHVELDYLSGSDSPFPPSKKIVLIFDGETLACRDVNIKYRPFGEEVRIELVKEGKLFTAFSYLFHFPFDPANLQRSIYDLPAFLRNSPKTAFAYNQDGISASRKFEEKPPIELTENFTFPEKAAYNISSREFHRVDTGYKSTATAEWDRSGEIWYIRTIEKSDLYPDPEKIKDPTVRYPAKGRVYKKLTYKSFEANAIIDPALFQLPALDLVKGARLIQADAEGTKAYRNDPPAVQGQTDESILKGLERLPLEAFVPRKVQEPKKDPPSKKE